MSARIVQCTVCPRYSTIIVRIRMWQPLGPRRISLGNNKVILNGIILLLIHRRILLHEKCPWFICFRTYLLYCDHIWSLTQRRIVVKCKPGFAMCAYVKTSIFVVWKYSLCSNIYLCVRVSIRGEQTGNTISLSIIILIDTLVIPDGHEGTREAPVISPNWL